MPLVLVQETDCVYSAACVLFITMKDSYYQTHVPNTSTFHVQLSTIGLDSDSLEEYLKVQIYCSGYQMHRYSTLLIAQGSSSKRQFLLCM